MILSENGPRFTENCTGCVQASYLKMTLAVEGGDAWSVGRPSVFSYVVLELIRLFGVHPAAECRFDVINGVALLKIKSCIDLVIDLNFNLRVGVGRSFPSLSANI